MSSRKCYVCNSKSSSLWFKFSKELSEDLCACFNVEEIVSDESLCASCRRDLTRWRASKPTNGKYFVAENSRGKPCVNKATMARQNRKSSLLKSNSSEFSPLLHLPEDLFLVVVAFLGISDISRLRQTCNYVNQLCTSNFLWKLLLKRDFPEKCHLDESVLSNSSLAYKLFYMSKLSVESHCAQMAQFVERLNVKERKLLEENEDIKRRLSDLHVRLQCHQNDPDPRMPVTKLQEQVSLKNNEAAAERNHTIVYYCNTR